MSSKKKDQKVVSLEKEQDKRTITVPDEDTHLLPFTSVPNEVLDHPDINATGKLLMVYLLKHAGIPGWIYLDSEMQKFLECGRNKLEAAFKCLRKAGYSTLVILRDSNGQVSGSKRIFARTPKYLELNKNRLTVVPKTLEACDSHRDPENRGPGHRSPGARGLLQRKTIKNKNFKNTKQSPAPTKPTPEVQQPCQEPDQDVVVSLFEQVQQWAISEVLVRTWLKRHSAEYILCKIEYTKSYATKNPAGLLRRAIENDYKLPLSKQAKIDNKAPTAYVYPTHEENIAWYEKLSDNEKMAYLKAAVHRHPMFENHLKHQKLSVLDQGFAKNGLFKDLMQLVGRAK